MEVGGRESFVTVTPLADGTFTTIASAIGERLAIKVVTSGTVSRTLTFGTGFKSTGTLATGTVNGKVFMLEFVSDGTTLNEISRTAAM
jgi:hypothetical protein